MGTSITGATPHPDATSSFAGLRGRLFGIAYRMQGAHRVAGFLAAVARWLWDGAIVTPRDVNGHGAVLIEREGTPFALLTVGASSDGIDRVFWVMNPAKMAAILSPPRG